MQATSTHSLGVNIMSNLVNTMTNLVIPKFSKVISILTAGRTVTKTDRSTKGYDIKCNGTYIWFFISSPQDDRFDPTAHLLATNCPKSRNLRFFTEGVDIDTDELTIDDQVDLALWVADNGHEWRCQDEDGVLHGKGYYYGDDDESLFAPQELIQWNTGATTIEIRERKYKLIEDEDGTVSLKRDGIEGWSYV